MFEKLFGRFLKKKGDKAAKKKVPAPSKETGNENEHKHEHKHEYDNEHCK